MLTAAASRALRRTYHWAAERRLSERDRLARHWVNVLDGDHTYRLDYPLGPDCVVVDVGGYKGDFASDIVARFCCEVHVFEPVEAYAAQVQRRFAQNPRVQVHAFGLAASSRDELIDLRGDETSAAAGTGSERIELRAVGPVLAALPRVDLLKLNIEGLEYEVLDSLIETGALTDVRFVQVQFHDFFPHASERREAIRSALRKTHRLDWDFPFVWESWSRHEPA